MVLLLIIIAYSKINDSMIKEKLQDLRMAGDFSPIKSCQNTDLITDLFYKPEYKNIVWCFKVCLNGLLLPVSVIVFSCVLI